MPPGGLDSRYWHSSFRHDGKMHEKSTIQKTGGKWRTGSLGYFSGNKLQFVVDELQKSGTMHT
jgi:hypothetical protein